MLHSFAQGVAIKERKQLFDHSKRLAYLACQVLLAEAWPNIFLHKKKTSEKLRKNT